MKIKKPHVRAKTTVEVHRLFHIKSLALVLWASDEGMFRQMGLQIAHHANVMLEPYIKEQNALAKAVRERRKKR